MAKRKEEGGAHYVSEQALAKIYCVCGWNFMPESLKGLSDYQLQVDIETQLAEHINEMRRKEECENN